MHFHKLFFLKKKKILLEFSFHVKFKHAICSKTSERLFDLGLISNQKLIISSKKKNIFWNITLKAHGVDLERTWVLRTWGANYVWLETITLKSLQLLVPPHLFSFGLMLPPCLLLWLTLSLHFVTYPLFVCNTLAWSQSPRTLCKQPLYIAQEPVTRIPWRYTISRRQ